MTRSRVHLLIAAAIVAASACRHDWDAYDPRLRRLVPPGAGSGGSSADGSSSSATVGPGGRGGSAGYGGAPVGRGGAGGGGGAGGCAPLGGAGYAAEVEADGPVAYWRAGDPVGSTFAKDEVSGGDATCVGVVTFGVPGAIVGDADTAMALDGTSYLTLYDNFDFVGSAPFTVEAWVKPDVRDDQYRWLFGKVIYDAMNHRTGYLAFTRQPGMDAMGFQRWLDEVPKAYVNVSDPPPPSVWSHFVARFDGQRTGIWLNGMLAGEGLPDTTALPDHRGAFHWGADPAGTSRWIGSLDELAIYAAALDPCRIEAHYAAVAKL